MWYDSLTIYGEIAWQDRLSLLNQPFFNVTDGIFTNYTWKQHHPACSSKLAGERRRDVFTGIDVWGRNTFGGGEFGCSTALQVIQNASTSCAIFAPAWTFEKLGSSNFPDNDDRFWLSLTGADESKVNPRSVPQSTWFATNFDQGHGSLFSVNGVRVWSAVTWSNLSHQDLLPSFRGGSSPLKLITHDAFNGGSCLQIELNPRGVLGIARVPLFKTHLRLQGSTVAVGAFMLSSGETCLSGPTVCLELTTENGDTLLCDWNNSAALRPDGVWQQIVGAIHHTDARITEIALSFDCRKMAFRSNLSIRVGELKLVPHRAFKSLLRVDGSLWRTTSKVTDLYVSDRVEEFDSGDKHFAIFTVKWNAPRKFYRHYNIYCDREFIGSAFANCYRIVLQCGILPAQLRTSVKVTVQGVDCYGFPEVVDRCLALDVYLKG